MGTYLILELKDKSARGIAKANALWAFDNRGDGFQDTVKFRSEQDTLTDIEYIRLDDGQAHLRVFKQPEQLESDICFLRRGTFQVKITLGDYLCSEMAKRYLLFIKEHRKLLDPLSDNVMKLLREKAKTRHKAEDCLVKCPFCRDVW